MLVSNMTFVPDVIPKAFQANRTMEQFLASMVLLATGASFCLDHMSVHNNGNLATPFSDFGFLLLFFYVLMSVLEYLVVAGANVVATVTGILGLLDVGYFDVHSKGAVVLKPVWAVGAGKGKFG